MVHCPVTSLVTTRLSSVVSITSSVSPSCFMATFHLWLQKPSELHSIVQPPSSIPYPMIASIRTIVMEMATVLTFNSAHLDDFDIMLGVYV